MKFDETPPAFDVECLYNYETLENEEKSENVYRSLRKIANKKFRRKVARGPKQLIIQVDWRTCRNCDASEGFEYRYLVITMSSAQTCIFVVKYIRSEI